MYFYYLLISLSPMQDCPNEALLDTSCVSTTRPPSQASLQALGKVFKIYMSK